MGVEFNQKREDWDLAKDPEGGLKVVGIPLWGADQLFDHIVGSETTIRSQDLSHIVDSHARQLSALSSVVSHAPHGRDVGSCVERVVRLCVASRLVHIARIIPPEFSVPILKQCQAKTLDFVCHQLYAWKESSFWNAQHEKLVRWNVELPIKNAGTGLVPQWKLANASFAASWFQPIATMAAARRESEVAFLNHLNECEVFPSIQMLKNAVGAIGYNDDLLQTHEAFQQALQDEIKRQLARLSPDEQKNEFIVRLLKERVRKNFKYQKFFCRGILDKYAKTYRERLAHSTLPFASNELARIEDREDKFARRIF